MTRKDYELIARAIKCGAAKAKATADNREDFAGAHYAATAQREIAIAAADALAADNPRFDRARFLQECGVSA